MKSLKSYFQFLLTTYIQPFYTKYIQPFYIKYIQPFIAKYIQPFSIKYIQPFLTKRLPSFVALNPRKKLIYLGIAIILLFIILIACCHKRSDSVAGQPVNVITAKFQPYKVIYTVTGNISSDFLPVLRASSSDTVSQINVNPGDVVSKDQVLMSLTNQLQTTKLNQANADYHTAQDEYNSAVKEYAMNKELADSGTISQLSLLQANLKMQSAQEKLSSAQQEVQQAQIELSKAVIKSPMNGYIASVDVSVGSQVEPGDKLLTLVNNNQLTAKFPFPQNRLSEFKAGQVVNMYTADPSQSITAQVSGIQPDVDQQSGLFDILVTFNNKYNWLIGSSLTGNITVRTYDQALMLPDTAIVTRTNGSVIFIVIKNTAYEVPVKILQRNQDNIAVLASIKPNSNIVTYGAGYLYNGSKVMIVGSNEDQS